MGFNLILLVTRKFNIAERTPEYSIQDMIPKGLAIFLQVSDFCWSLAFHVDGRQSIAYSVLELKTFAIPRSFQCYGKFPRHNYILILQI
jgi:hypothetical protein